MGLSSGNGVGLSLIVNTPGVVVELFANQSPVNLPAQSGLQIIVVNNPAPTTINLPNPYALNQQIEIQDGSMLAATNNITVQGNGNNINNPNGAASSYVIGQNGTGARFTAQGSLNTWGVT